MVPFHRHPVHPPVLQQQACDQAVPSHGPRAFPSALRHMVTYVTDSGGDSLLGQLFTQMITKLLGTRQPLVSGPLAFAHEW